MNQSSNGFEDLREYLVACGAAGVGFADISDLSPDGSADLHSAICIVLPLPPYMIVQTRNGGRRPRYAERAWQAALRELAVMACQRLEAQGKQGRILPFPVGRDPLSELIAVRAGMAWIGKCAHPVTWDYGSAARVGVVLTDAVIPADTSVVHSFCGNCTACRDACQAGAVHGIKWEPGMTLEQLVDVDACIAHVSHLAKEDLSCRMCMDVCPFTRVYLTNAGYDSPEQAEEPA